MVITINIEDEVCLAGLQYRATQAGYDILGDFLTKVATDMGNAVARANIQAPNDQVVPMGDAVQLARASLKRPL